MKEKTPVVSDESDWGVSDDQAYSLSGSDVMNSDDDFSWGDTTNLKQNPDKKRDSSNSNKNIVRRQNLIKRLEYDLAIDSTTDEIKVKKSVISYIKMYIETIIYILKSVNWQIYDSTRIVWNYTSSYRKRRLKKAI